MDSCLRYGGCLFNVASLDRRCLLCKWYFAVIVVVISWFAIQREESEITYLIDAFVSFSLLLVVFSNESLQRILGFRKTISALGKYSMEMFLIHPLVYCKSSTMGTMYR